MSRHDEPVDYIHMIAQTGQDCSEDISEVLEIVRSLEHHPGYRCTEPAGLIPNQHS